ncbi:hypothetical protein PXNS11_60147 [Stutzerimonas xanthomarina]|nr:hypothetical protein PXNS11_60147 [Stutzerimonas xanthomarina]
MSACRPAPPLGSWPDRQRTTGLEVGFFMACELITKQRWRDAAVVRLTAAAALAGHRTIDPSGIRLFRLQPSLW